MTQAAHVQASTVFQRITPDQFQGGASIGELNISFAELVRILGEPCRVGRAGIAWYFVFQGQQFGVSNNDQPQRGVDLSLAHFSSGKTNSWSVFGRDEALLAKLGDFLWLQAKNLPQAKPNPPGEAEMHLAGFNTLDLARAVGEQSLTEDARAGLDARQLERIGLVILSNEALIKCLLAIDSERDRLEEKQRRAMWAKDPEPIRWTRDDDRTKEELAHRLEDVEAELKRHGLKPDEIRMKAALDALPVDREELYRFFQRLGREDGDKPASASSMEDFLLDRKMSIQGVTVGPGEHVFERSSGNVSRYPLSANQLAITVIEGIGMPRCTTDIWDTATDALKHHREWVS